MKKATKKTVKKNKVETVIDLNVLPEEEKIQVIALLNKQDYEKKKSAFLEHIKDRIKKLLEHIEVKDAIVQFNVHYFRNGDKYKFGEDFYSVESKFVVAEMARRTKELESFIKEMRGKNKQFGLSKSDIEDLIRHDCMYR